MEAETPEIAEDLDSRADYVMGLLQAEPARDDKGRFAATHEEAPAEEPGAEQDSPADGDVAPGEPASDEEAEVTTEQTEESAIALPIGWSADKADAFKQLPPDVRDYIAARESERTKHFDKTAQETAAQRKAVEADRQAVTAERQRYAQALGAVMQQYQQALPKAPDVQLAASDPAKYIAEKAKYDDAMSRLQTAHAEMARVQEEEQRNRDKAFQEHMAEQAKLLDEKIPEWQDKAKREKDQQDITAFLRTTGYSQEEIAAVADARAVQIARKAMLYDRLMAQKPAEKKVTPAATPTLKPGTAASPSAKPNARAAALKQRALSSDDPRVRAEYVLAALNTR